MEHSTPLISTIVVGIGLAFVFGALANRLKIPPLVGYLVAGILVGPFTPGYVADQNLAPELAELGVILLMFGVGLHFSLKDLVSVGPIAVPGAIIQIAVATALGWSLGWTMGWSVPEGIVFGLALSTASTVVLLRAMQERRLVDTHKGHIAIGWLIVEDMAMVMTLVLLPAMAGLIHGAVDGGIVHQDWFARKFDLGLWGMLGVTMGKVAAFIIFMLVVGRRVIPWGLHRIAHSGSRELFRLAVLAIALGVAYGAAQLFGVSLALGAFFAGMVLSESELSHQAAQETLPLRDAFAVLFFVSVGMLFDPDIILEQPLQLLAVLFIILFGKSLAAFLIVLAFRHPVSTALTISASLAQIGEFSFIMATIGVQLNMLPEDGRALILAGAIISIMLNPLMFVFIEFLDKRNKARAELAAYIAAHVNEDQEPESPVEEEEGVPVTTLENHIILVGYGRVGSLVGDALRSHEMPYLVLEDSDKVIGRLRDSEVEVLSGNAASADVLRTANIENARCLVLTIPNAFEAGQVVQQARTLNPDIDIVAGAYSDAEVEHLISLGANRVVMGAREIARGISHHLVLNVLSEEEEQAKEREEQLELIGEHEEHKKAETLREQKENEAARKEKEAETLKKEAEALEKEVEALEKEAETLENEAILLKEDILSGKDDLQAEDRLQTEALAEEEDGVSEATEDEKRLPPAIPEAAAS